MVDVHRSRVVRPGTGFHAGRQVRLTPGGDQGPGDRLRRGDLPGEDGVGPRTQVQRQRAEAIRRRPRIGRCQVA